MIITINYFYFRQYISTPQLAYDCMLKQTKIVLPLLYEPDQILFLESNIRGGMSFIAQRHAKANPNLSLEYIDVSKHV